MSATRTPAGPAAVAAADGFRSRARRALRGEISAVAMDLFLAQGFDDTTVEQIAAAAGMSRSSFFRYFPTKEDVVVGHLAAYGQQILDALSARPDAEPPWTALRMALEPVIQTNDTVRARQTSRMSLHTPTLRARHHEKTMTWSALLLPEMARRMGIPEPHLDDPRPAALIACALACLDVAIGTWTSSETDTSLTELVDVAMNSVRPPDLP